MLRPILSALDDYTPPAGLDAEGPKTHFASRAENRGVKSIDGELLKWLVERALHEGRADLIEKVFDVCPATAIYRVLLPEGPFYPVVRQATLKARTLYSRDELRGQRFGRRMRKRLQGRRSRRAVTP